MIMMRMIKTQQASASGVAPHTHTHTHVTFVLNYFTYTQGGLPRHGAVRLVAQLQIVVDRPFVTRLFSTRYSVYLLY